jgi:hypothetical protein
MAVNAVRLVMALKTEIFTACSFDTVTRKEIAVMGNCLLWFGCISIHIEMAVIALATFDILFMTSRAIVVT